MRGLFKSGVFKLVPGLEVPALDEAGLLTVRRREEVGKDCPAADGEHNKCVCRKTEQILYRCVGEEMRTPGGNMAKQKVLAD